MEGVNMTTTDAPVVRSFEPAAHMKNLMKVGNAVLTPMLRSRWGARMHELALLTVTGRRTGTRYTTPVSVQEFEGNLVVLTASGWRVNLRGGADVELRHDGVERTMHADLVEDPDEVARVYGELLKGVGLAKANHVGLKVSGDRMPTHDELVDAIGHHRAVVVLTPS
jgi:hypothetical protein